MAATAALDMTDLTALPLDRRLVVFGCLWQQNTEARRLSSSAHAALRHVAAVVIQAKARPLDGKPLAEAVASAQRQVTRDMIAAHCSGFRYWQPAPMTAARGDMFTPALLVPMGWGAAWCAGYYLRNWLPAQAARTARTKALRVAAVIDDFAGFYRLAASPRAWSTASDLNRALRDYERAERKAGVPSVIIAESRALGLPQPVGRCPAAANDGGALSDFPGATPPDGAA